MRRILTLAEMNRAVDNRDESYDGIFFIAIRTTGILCRPSCPSRPSRRHNREFYANVQQALAAGYRPCKRCRPLDTNGRPPAWVEKLLGLVAKNPKARVRDADLRAMGIDPARARRYFHRHFDMTFQAYSRSCRMGQALKDIREGTPLDNVITGHGYESHSGFRDAFHKLFGDAPGRSRTAECLVAGWFESPLGPLVLAACDQGLCLLEFSDRRMLQTQFDILRKRFGWPIVPGDHRYLTQAKEELAEYFVGGRTKFTVPLIYPGSPFQTTAWDELRKIPYGKTISYEELAQKIGSPRAQRAVGRANGQNRIAIMIPCHRVVNKGGKLGGYGGGLWRKEFLLELEGGAVNVPPRALVAGPVTRNVPIPAGSSA
jgi:AraC family transcriptional regulator of adaptative response/methylated-DNA-[protein]-cysteine methyltransferase